ncbi:uncharacterized protein LOC109608917 [Aethina tumida]|uniref:uncharacterized protein LOC109608917 n=1 Tax=Aethina tumida TaxID=116153 RepID=UPI0021497AC4|nr:uncharacterized protein LOC109608917 [Aethina tumida]
MPLLYPLNTKYLTVFSQWGVYFVLSFVDLIIFLLPHFETQYDESHLKIFISEFQRYVIVGVGVLLFLQFCLSSMLIVGILLESPGILKLWKILFIITLTPLIVTMIGSGIYMITAHTEIYLPISYIVIALLLIAFSVHTLYMVKKEEIRLEANIIRGLIYNEKPSVFYVRM